MMNIFEKLGMRTAGNDAEHGMNGGRDTESAPVSAEQQKEVKAAELRERIGKLDEGIQSITASIERVVGRIQEGSRVAEQRGDKTLMALNARLEAEAQAEKLKLLEQKELFAGNRQRLEEELANL
ncbi:MAG: hypothetical protein WAW00_00060 [Candidatus Moraniibacteriota bacterium]